jgi:hypothetical protein
MNISDILSIVYFIIGFVISVLYVNIKYKQEIDEKNIETGKEVASTRDIAKLDWHNFLLGTLTEYEGIRTALTNRKDIDYRYIVDTFEGLVDTELHKELALIAKEKDNAVAFLNFPSVKAFKSCTYSSFTDDKGKFQVKYIKDGANKQKPAAK